MSDTLKEIKRVDKETFEWIYKVYYLPLCFHAQKIIGRKVTAEDIVQDVFTKLWEECGTIKITGSLQAYLQTCVRNKCWNYVDHSRVKRKHAQAISDDTDTFPAHDSNDPSSILIALEMEDRINDTIDALPAQCRGVFLMWWKEGLKYDKIAQKLGISTGAVGAQINRARMKIEKSPENIGKIKKNHGLVNNSS
jgi:RNA polymerase sigma-70 factor (ECF subfamily)